ncbi:hypothetical protein FACS1894147_03910 [Spirochaetia bacterium]|nr:hypothetical protein FACS1894147_03910 [Spirochaetia bacterium]
MKKCLLLIFVFQMVGNHIYAQSKIEILAFIDNNQIEDIQKLLDNGYNINTEAAFNYTPLIYAIDKNNIEVVEFLIKYKPDLELCTNMGSPITVAARNNNRKMIELLLDNGADINNDFRFSDRRARTDSAIFIAAIRLDFELFDYLLSKGADVNTGRLLEDENALMAVISNYSTSKYITYRSETIRMVNKLIENGIDINHSVYYGNALTQAVSRNDEELVEIILKNGFDLNIIIPDYNMTTYEYLYRLKKPDIMEIIDKYK